MAKINIQNGTWSGIRDNINSNFTELYNRPTGSSISIEEITDELDERYLAIEDAPNMVTSGESINLIDLTKIDKTKAVNKNNEEYNILPIPEELGFILSGPISVTPGEELTFSGFREDKHFQCQDANGVQLTTNKGFKIYSSNGDPVYQIIPAGCYRIQGNLKLDTDANPFPQFQIQRGHITTPVFTPYAENVTRVRFGALEADRLSEGAQMWKTSGGSPVLVDIATVDQINGAMEAIPSDFTKILALGTSITNDVGASEPSKGFRTVLADILTETLGRTITVINGGVSGQASNSMNDSLQGLLNTHAPQIVLIEVAINDARNDVLFPTATTISNLRQMVDKTRASGAVPIIWGCYPLGQTDWGSLSQRSRIIAAGRMVANQKLCQFVDFEAAMADNKLLLADGIHPNDDGHRLGAGLLSAAILK